MSVENVKMYFCTSVCFRKGKPSTQSCWVAAIQYYVDKAPKGRHLPAGWRIRDNEDINTALSAQKVRNREMGGTANPGSEPHYGLKDQIAQAERDAMMGYIYKNRPDWGPASVSFAWGLNAGVRGASNRSLVLADLNMSYGFAPPCSTTNTNDGNRAALMLVIRSGDLHKDRHETDQQVAVWRHRYYKQCSVFATACHLIWSLANNNELHFKHDDKKKRAPWWDVPLINWSNYQDTSNATKQIMDGCGVKAAKITHHRTAALQYAGFNGLAPWQVNTLTNHTIEKQLKAYQSVAEKQVSKKHAPKTLIILLLAEK